MSDPDVIITYVMPGCSDRKQDPVDAEVERIMTKERLCSSQ